MRRRSHSVSPRTRRARSRWQHRREAIQRLAVVEPLETRDMLTVLSLLVQDMFPAESFGPAATLGELSRYGADNSQPLTVMLASSDESEVLVPESVTIPANESMVTFPIDIVDDTLLDGEQQVLITASVGIDSTDAWIFVQDHETADVSFDQSELSPGDTLTGTITISVAGNTVPVSVPLVSDRPDEIASIVVEVPVGQQSVDFEIPVTSNGIAEGPHAVQLEVPYETGLYGNPHWLLVSDPGVNTLQPASDGHARDADLDGQVFEQLTLTSTQITTQAASSSGSFGQSRGILEFDVSTIPSGATIHSAVLTLQIGGMSGTTPMPIDFVAYAGNGTVEADDAVQTGANIGQLTITPGIESLKSTPVILDATLLQSLVETGDYVGIVSKLAPPLANTGRYLSYSSVEHPYDYYRPSLHLVWSVSGGPAITANSLTIQENLNAILTSADLAATDSDSDEASLVFTVSNVTRGQFLVNWSPATSFTQADIAAGRVVFEHDGSELSPSYEVTVSDGTTSFGPQAATINFINVNDELPLIVPGQVFEVSETAENDTVIGSVAFSDGDLPGDDFLFAIIAGDDDGVFAIDDTGLLTVRDETLLDYETTASYVLTIAVIDDEHWTNEEVTINVIDEEVEGIAPLLSIDYTEFHENLGAGGVTWAHVSRVGEDLSQPWTIVLTSSIPSKLNMPTEVTIPAYETTASFMIGVNDDTLFTGPQVVTVTARLVGGGSTSVDVTVLDVETVAIQFDDAIGSPGETLVATVSASSTNRTEPLTILLESSRPHEIVPISVVLDPSQQSVVVPVPITADNTAEGLHRVKVTVSAPGYEGDGQMLAPPGHTKWVEIFDPGVVTKFPVADNSATDADRDGNVFEQLAGSSTSIVSQAASLSGSFGETRGILEFDASSVPAGAIVESAVLTLDVYWAGDYPFVNNVVLDVFAFQGNGIVESADASQIGNHVGQLSMETGGSFGLGSFPIVLDVNDVQSLVESGGQIGIVTKIQETLLTFKSVESHPISSRPALHLTLAYPPALVTNALSLNEGETKTLTAGHLSATDTDSDESALTFKVSSVTGGQFLVGGAPATTFTQAQIAAGQVAFVHDGSEVAPSFAVEVSDGTYSDGPQPASINFANVNDNAPQIPAGQTFAVSEAAGNGTLVGIVAFSDADLSGDSFVVTITAGNSDGIFGIDNEGNLYVADNSDLDFESTSTCSLTISISDGVNTSHQLVTVNVLNVVETKFYVVDDGSANRTYEYEAPGSAIENYTLNSANTAPRGAASTITGDRVWVVDNNRKVYVYNTEGGLLGSWTAGSLASNATPHGIATNGTDIWIVDDRSNKVFKYAGAASRLSGSESAASSFNLNSSNGTPRDIVTDGASLWVVNDASTNKVFKYSVAGSLLGSWTIDAANATPTGITIDPANVSDIWIVDSGTDRVYQYTGAATRTSGSQSAAASFQLSPGNTNPQGIADPPPQGVNRHESFSVQSDATSADMRPTIAFSTIAAETRSDKQNVSVFARQRFFESLATELLDASDNRGQTSVSASPRIAILHEPAIDHHTVADDLFESGLADLLGLRGHVLSARALPRGV
jgi:hypothetical protein